MRRFHPGTFASGLVFTALGAALAAEGAGWWTFRLRDMGLVLPIALVVIGLTILAGTWGRGTLGRERARSR